MYCLIDFSFSVSACIRQMGSAGVAKRLQSAPHAVDRAFQDILHKLNEAEGLPHTPSQPPHLPPTAFPGSSSELAGARRSSSEPLGAVFFAPKRSNGHQGRSKDAPRSLRDLPAPPKDGPKVKSMELEIIEKPLVLIGK